MKKYIKVTNMPPSLNLSSLAISILLADRFSAPEWVYGVIATVYVLNSISFVFRIYKETGVDIFEEEK